MNLESKTDVEDQYEDNYLFTPTGWIKKLNRVTSNFRMENLPVGYAFTYDDSFEYNDKVQESCDNIQLLKKLYCKDESIPSCKMAHPIYKLEEYHNLNMRCRNIRALENNSDCIIHGKKLIKHHENHATQINQLSNATATCIDYYNNKIF